MRKQVKIHFVEGNVKPTTGYVSLPVLPETQFVRVFDKDDNLKALCHIAHIVLIEILEE